MVTLAVCAGGKSGGKRKRAGSSGGKTKMAGDAQGACSVSLHSASLLPLSSRSCVVRPRTADRSKNQQGGGGARIQTCAVTEGSLEQLLKAGEREFSRNPVAAEDCYRRAVAADKTSVLALYNLGLSQMNQRRHDDAISNFELVSIVLCASCHAILPCADSLRRAQALSLHPRYGEAYFGLGSTLYDKAGPAAAPGQASRHKELLTRAKSALKRAIKLTPAYFAAHNALGNVCLGLQDLKGAQKAYEDVIKLNPRAPEGHANLARVLASTGQSTSATKAIHTAIELSPENVALYHELASVYKNSGEEQLAKRVLRAALRLAPRHAASHYHLGEMLAGTVFSTEKDIPGAMRHLTRAVQLDPTMAEAYMSLGMLYWGQGQLFRARDLLQAGLRARPFSEGHANLGIVLSDLGDYDGAIEHFEASMRLNPRLPEAPKCLGDTYKHLNRWKEAITMYEKALVLRPNYWEALNDLVHARQHTCDWKAWAKNFALLQRELARELARGGQPLFVKPFHALVYPLEVEHMLLVARSYAARAIRLVKSLLPRPMTGNLKLIAAKGGNGPHRIRVGWVSSNIGDHSLTHLMRSVFGMHGRKVVSSVFALNGDNDPGDPRWRQEVKERVGAANFFDMSQMSGVQGAHLINQKKIHVLIDLVGYTGGGERANEVFAAQPCELQTSYMGFCASTGAPYMQHMIVDRVVAPPEHQSQFSERLMVVPNSYFCNDHRQQKQWAAIGAAPTGADRSVARAPYPELPASGMVLACFNQLYKIDDAVFKVWMSALKAKTSAVLWLLKFPPIAVTNIVKEARAHGVADGQVVFGNTLAKKEYLERAVQADLFLDTPLVNAHTSATDVLWAGVPVITTPRVSMISRVASSLCLAGNLPQMVAPNLKEYAAILDQFLEKPKHLARLRAATRVARDESPLFDTQLWVDYLDVALTMAWESRAAQRAMRKEAKASGGSKGKAGHGGFHVIVAARRDVANHRG